MLIICNINSHMEEFIISEGMSNKYTMLQIVLKYIHTQQDTQSYMLLPYSSALTMQSQIVRITFHLPHLPIASIMKSMKFVIRV